MDNNNENDAASNQAESSGNDSQNNGNDRQSPYNNDIKNNSAQPTMQVGSDSSKQKNDPLKNESTKIQQAKKDFKKAVVDGLNPKSAIFNLTISIMKWLVKLLVSQSFWILCIVSFLIFCITLIQIVSGDRCYVTNIPQHLSYTATPRDLSSWLDTEFKATSSNNLEMEISGTISLSRSIKIEDSEFKNNIPNFFADYKDADFSVGNSHKNGTIWNSNLDLINGFLVNEGDEVEILVPTEDEPSLECKTKDSFTSKCNTYTPFVSRTLECKCFHPGTDFTLAAKQSRQEYQILNSTSSWIQDNPIFLDIMATQPGDQGRGQIFDRIFNKTINGINFTLLRESFIDKNNFFAYNLSSEDIFIPEIPTNTINKLSNINPRPHFLNGNISQNIGISNLDPNVNMQNGGMFFVDYNKKFESKNFNSENMRRLLLSQHLRTLYDMYKKDTEKYEENLLNELTRMINLDQKINIPYIIFSPFNVKFVAINGKNFAKGLKSKLQFLIALDEKLYGGRGWQEFGKKNYQSIAYSFNLVAENINQITKVIDNNKEYFAPNNCPEAAMKKASFKFHKNNQEAYKYLCPMSKETYGGSDIDLKNKPTWLNKGIGLEYRLVDIEDIFKSDDKIDFKKIKEKSETIKPEYVTNIIESEEALIDGKIYKVYKKKFSNIKSSILSFNLLKSEFSTMVNGGYTIRVRHNNLITQKGKSISSGYLLDKDNRIIDLNGKKIGEIRVAFSEKKPDDNFDGQAINFNNEGSAFIRMEEGKKLWLKMIHYGKETIDLSSGQYKFKGKTSTVNFSFDFKKIIDFFERNIQDKAKEYLTGEIFKSKQLGGGNILFTAISFCLVLYIIFYGIQFGSGSTNISVNDFLIRMSKLLLVLGLSNQYTINFLHESLVPFLGSFYEIIISDSSIQVGLIFDWLNRVGGIDALLIKISAMFMVFGLGTLSSIAVLGCVMFLIFFTCQVTAGIIISKLNLLILISFAPIFIVLMLFEKTKELSLNWVKYILAYTMEPIIVMISISFIFPLAIYYLIDILGFSPCFKVISLVNLLVFRLPIRGIGIWGYSTDDGVMNKMLEGLPFAPPPFLYDSNLYFLAKISSLLGLIISTFLLIKVYNLAIEISQKLFSVNSSDVQKLIADDKGENFNDNIKGLGNNVKATYQTTSNSISRAGSLINMIIGRGTKSDKNKDEKSEDNDAEIKIKDDNLDNLNQSRDIID